MASKWALVGTPIIGVITGYIKRFKPISVYNAEGYFQKNPHNAYSFNNLTANKDSDGGITIHFGGDPKQSNYLPITKGWNYTVRLYRPQAAILDGSWISPKAQVAK